jgi:DNA polymerase-3 subunit delta'
MEAGRRVVSFATLIGNSEVKAALQAAIATGRLAQALLFSGPAGVGKRQFALTVAKALNCRTPVAGESCDQCLPCRHIERGEFLDVLTIAPETHTLKIDQVRRVIEEALYKPFQGRARVFLLDPADALTEQAANALLKTLEEPPPTSFLILITTRAQQLLATIRSRCQHYRFEPLTVAEIEHFLRQRFQRPESEIRLLARLAHGQIGRALAIDLSIYEGMRRDMIELLGVLTSGDRERLIRAAEYLGRRLTQKQCEEHLDVLTLLLADLARLTENVEPASLINADMAERLAPLAGRLGREGIIRLNDRLEKFRRDLARNIHRQIALESLLLAESEQARSGTRGRVL